MPGSCEGTKAERRLDEEDIMGSLEGMNRDQVMECAQLYVKVFNAEPWNDGWTMETSYQRLIDNFDTPNFAGVLYQEDGRVKGAAFGNIEQFYNGRHYMLKEMFVSPEIQGKGVGRTILRELEEKLKAFGVTTMVLLTSKGKDTVRFYINNGFEEWPSMVMMGKEI